MHTHSLCPHCYRHVEAELFESRGAIRMRKLCPEHGEQLVVVENDPDHYRRIVANRGRFREHQDVIVLDVTDKCNLTCAHCYHIPDNNSPNKAIGSVLREVRATPEPFSIILGGAEPTIRRDLPELVHSIRAEGRSVGVLSNGVRFADETLTAGIAPHLDGYVLIGLNHERYHGRKVHDKQLLGLRHLRNHGVRPLLGYTAEHDELVEILLESLALYRQDVISLVRLRFGANIGRHPDMPAMTLSDHLKVLRQVCRGLRLDLVVIAEADNTLYHQMVLVAGMPVRVIQWPDVENIVMDELTRAPWARFIDGPVSNFCHQIILRDGFFHRNTKRPDDVPARYTLEHLLQTRSSMAVSPNAPVSSGTLGPDLGNARCLTRIGDCTVANLHERMTEPQRAAIVRFWLDTGALSDRREALSRASQVVHLVFDARGDIVAVNTCFSAFLNNGRNQAPYWFYRIFVHPKARSVRLSLEIFRLTASYLRQRYMDSGGETGIAMHLENPKFYRRSGHRALRSVGIKPKGRDQRGVDIWTYEFAPDQHATREH